MKNKLLSLFIICLFTLLGNAQLSTGGGSACNCETVLNPTFELTDFNADACTATLMANPGDSPCIDNYYLIYKWYRANGEETIVLNNPSVTFNDFGDLGEVKVLVEARISQSGYTICSKVSDSITYNDVTCSFNDDGDVTITKRAYRYDGGITNVRLGVDDADGNDVGGTVYKGQLFEWRVVIENTTTAASYTFGYNDIFPNVPGCAFTTEEVTMTQGGTITTITTMSDIITINPGTTTISYITRANNNAACANQTDNDGNCLPYTNKFGYDFFINPGKTSLNADVPTEGSGIVESSVCLRYGCPMGLADGFCLAAENMEAGDMLEVPMNGHVSFFGIRKMEGDIVYEFDRFNAPTIELIPSIANAGFTVSLGVPDSNGIRHFIIENTTNPFATFSISSSNAYKPLSIFLEFSQDLQECTTISVMDMKITTGANISDVFLDSGVFCVNYEDYNDQIEDYESAWIATPTGETCASTSEPLVLTALGPFETQNPNSEYRWTKNGDTTIIGEFQELNITSSGLYKVNITDQSGCDREADIFIDACPVTCSCGDLNPEITLTVEDCSVIPEVSVQNCENVNFIQFEWEFSNGNTFNGQNPPPQYNWPNGGNLTAKLRVKYAIGFQTCIELDAETAFIPCRGPIKRALSLYPNPAKSKVTVSIGGDTVTGTIEIINIYGLKVLETKASKKETKLNISKLREGIYFVRHIDENKNTTVKRLSIGQ